MAIQTYSPLTCQLDWIYDEDLFVLMISYYLKCFIPHQETNITYTYLYRYHLCGWSPAFTMNLWSTFKCQKNYSYYLSFFLEKVLDLLNFYFDNGSNRWSVQALSLILFSTQKVCHDVIFFQCSKLLCTTLSRSHFLHDKHRRF